MLSSLSQTNASLSEAQGKHQSSCRFDSWAIEGMSPSLSKGLECPKVPLTPEVWVGTPDESCMCKCTYAYIWLHACHICTHVHIYQAKIDPSHSHNLSRNKLNSQGCFALKLRKTCCRSLCSSALNTSENPGAIMWHSGREQTYHEGLRSWDWSYAWYCLSTLRTMMITTKWKQIKKSSQVIS